MHPDNREQPMPVVFTGPESSRSYFDMIGRFLEATVGAPARDLFRVIIDDPQGVARIMAEGIENVRAYRHERDEAYFYNWNLVIDADFQQPFEVTHEAMAALNLSRDQPPHELAADLRRAFSGVVAGNVREDGIRRVETHGPFELRGDATVARALDEVLTAFVADHRMKLEGRAYTPCFRVVA